MSKPNCDACTELRDYAPNFVSQGVTDTVATSLKNNTGLNPALTSLHDDCEDLNDVNDCLIGRLGQEVEKMDVCDWKDFMKSLMPNLYETLKAMIAAICGLWVKVTGLCRAVDALLNIVGGSNAKHHPMTPTATFREKFSAHAGDPAHTDITQYLFPDFQCEIRRGIGCDTSRDLILSRASLVITDGRISPYQAGISVEDLAVGDVLGTLAMSEVVSADAPESWWKRQLRSSGNHWPFSISSRFRVIVSLRGYVTIDGVTFNEELAEYGENTMVMRVAAIEDDHGTGTVTTRQADTLRIDDI